MRKPNSALSYLVLILIGLVFIASAVLKLISIENVDLFLYEHRVLNWTFTSMASRLLISIEAILGFMLIFRVRPKLTLRLAQIFLFAFSIYVLLKPLVFDLNDDNCHCFGTVIEFSSYETLAKNLILLAVSFLIPAYNLKPIRHEKLILGGLGIIIIASVFVVKPPDFIATRMNISVVNINQDAMSELISQKEVDDLGLSQGRKVVGLYSTNCKYCVMASRKLDVIIKKHGLDEKSFLEIYWGDESRLKELNKSRGLEIDWVMVSPLLFLEATNNRQPLVVLFEDGIIIDAYKLTTINERYIYEFINNN